MNRGILIMIALLLYGAAAKSQKSNGELVKIKGTVTAFENFVIKNAEISAKKTKSKALTDSMGDFEIMARKGDMLLFSANGFEKNKRKVTAGGEPLRVNLIMLEGQKHRKVAVGYGHMSEKDLIYALQNYSDLNNDYQKYTDMKDLLSRELVGVRVVDQGGIKVYSQGSQNVMNSGISTNTGEALFVLDGAIVPSIDFLQPRDIKSVRILKGAEASIYGSRSANGVVLIETRQ
jgi:TonB-dependent SusC/RagA subfamily outer membrane receptor